MNTKTLFFDTSDDNWKYSNSLDTSIIKSPYWHTSVLGFPLYGVKSISLKSVELLNTFKNVRAGNTSNAIYLQIVSSSLKGTITLNDKNYNNISNLVYDINTALNVWLPANGFTINQLTLSIIDVNLGTLKFTSTLGEFKFSSDSVLLSQILGFNSYSTSASGLLYNTCYNLSAEIYVSMSFSNLTTPSNSNSNKPQHFKIPLNNNYGFICNYNDNSNFKQIIYINEDNVNLSYINISVTDRWGYLIKNYNDFSFSLFIEYKGLF